MPTAINPALLIQGPALCQYKNKTFYSKGNIALLPKRDTFKISTAQHGEIEDREENLTVELKFTPVGRLDALSALWPYGSVVPGDLVHGVTKVSSIDTGTEIVTVVSTSRFRDGAPVRVATRGTLPAGLSAATLYYARILSATTLTLHTTEANALAGTSPVNITDAGTGDHFIVEQEYLVIHTFDGDKYTFHNAAVVAPPEMDLSAAKTVIGEVTFECFRKFATAATDAAAVYTKTSAAVTDTSFSPADIITQVYDFVWGASAPWSAMNTPDGIRAQFPLTLEPITDDAVGVMTRRISGLAASIRARPLGITVDQLLSKLALQDTGAGRGRRMTSTDVLNVSATGLYLRLYGPTLKTGQMNFDSKQDRVGELTWESARTYTAGVANALYYVGTSAPA